MKKFLIILLLVANVSANIQGFCPIKAWDDVSYLAVPVLVMGYSNSALKKIGVDKTNRLLITGLEGFLIYALQEVWIEETGFKDPGMRRTGTILGSLFGVGYLWKFSF